MTEQPTPQIIRSVLASAGFGRSDYGRPGVMWNAASSGFHVWWSWHFATPQSRYVAVGHIDAGQSFGEDEWREHLRCLPEWLSRYAEALDAAGYDAELRTGGESMQLAVTAREGEPSRLTTQGVPLDAQEGKR